MCSISVLKADFFDTVGGLFQTCRKRARLVQEDKQKDRSVNQGSCSYSTLIQAGLPAPRCSANGPVACQCMGSIQAADRTAHHLRQVRPLTVALLVSLDVSVRSQPNVAVCRVVPPQEIRKSAQSEKYTKWLARLAEPAIRAAAEAKAAEEVSLSLDVPQQTLGHLTFAFTPAFV